ncbi:hypothetical protein V1277_003677 [Bradyrhizobium sp. AZCC 1588]|uniref:restriction endonuclease n=1 Tax=unclassified Bradyrhizobium TaxID=2631580 RepID=UPI002FF079FD
MSKLGTQFELAVSDVVREYDPTANVRRGEWVIGPDGRRELDVLVEGTVDGVFRRTHIECKDYNPARGPIGIAIVDALESKHRDLQFDVSLLCSNAGFTIDAIRKAKRSRIGLIGVLRKSDLRIRYRVVDEIYIRRIDFVANSGEYKFDFSHPVKFPAGTDSKEILFAGLPVENWLTNRALLFVSANQVVKGVHRLKYRFKFPIQMAVRGGSVFANGCQVKFELKGSWIGQRIEINASSGLYDWIRRTVRLGPGNNTLEYKDVKFGSGGIPIEYPPNFSNGLPPLQEGETSILDLGGLKVPDRWDIPDLDRFVIDEDLTLIRSDLSPDAYRSN